MTASQHDQPGAVSIEGWHWKKEVQIGHIISTVIVAASAFMYITSMEKRITLIEQQLMAQKERDMRQDQATTEALHLIRGQLEKMDSKLDRALDRRP